jgi:hypothetical protein
MADAERGSNGVSGRGEVRVYGPDKPWGWSGFAAWVLIFALPAFAGIALSLGQVRLKWLLVLANVWGGLGLWYGISESRDSIRRIEVDPRAETITFRNFVGIRGRRWSRRQRFGFAELRKMWEWEDYVGSWEYTPHFEFIPSGGGVVEIDAKGMRAAYAAVRDAVGSDREARGPIESVPD